MKKILINSAGGFIGGHLAARFVKEKIDLVCADIKPTDIGFKFLMKHKIDCDLKNMKIQIKLQKM